MKIIPVIFLFSVSSLKLFAQTNNSPYSIVGIGDIEDGYYNRTSGMANTGIGYRSNNFLILNNPASLSALPKRLFNAEIGIRGTIANYYGSSVDQNNNQSSDITFKKVIAGTKITNHWGSAGGLVPFSAQNYEFTSPDPTLGTDYYTGSGGLNKVFWANSYDFFNHVSLGLDAAYLFGSLQQKKVGQDANGNELYSQNNRINLTNGYLTYGIQYYGKVGKKWEFSLGATYSSQTKLLARNTITIITPTDSVIPLYSQQLPENYFTLPTSFGFGFSVTHDKRYTLVGDFRHQDWSKLNYTDYHSYTLENSNRYSVGIEWSKKKIYYNTLIESRWFQAGFYYNDSYLKIYGQQLKDIGGTVGMGINSKKVPLSYAIALQYGIKGMETSQLIQTKYVNLTFSISYRDIWSSSKVRFF
jgi:hypothetical protein